MKAKQLINDLTVRLMKEAASVADKKGWCDAELSTSRQTRKEKTDAVETLHVEVDQLEASIAKLVHEADNDAMRKDYSEFVDVLGRAAGDMKTVLL